MDSKEVKLTGNLNEHRHGDITFSVQNPEGKRIEMLKLDANGDIYVKGRLAENDKEVVQAAREYFNYWWSKHKPDGSDVQNG